jgi:SRSO17 transposase
LIERLGDGAVKYYVSNAGRHISVRQMILWAHERWKIEQGYQQLKEESGLDHFEGRSWRGLHHHLTLCFMAYCFLQTVKKGKKSLWTLPRVRRWLNQVFNLTRCPECHSYHRAQRIALFDST